MKPTHILLALALSVPWLAASAQAAVVQISAGADLQAAIDQAQAGDTLRLAAGDYQGTGRTITVAAPNVTIKHITVTKSGMSLPNMDAGIFLDKAADAAHIVENNILDNSVGVYLWGAPNAVVERNTIIGNQELRENERGNGVTVWNAPNSKVIYNDISHGRDGIFSNASNFNTFSHNHFHDLRYGVHYMYTNDSQIEDNVVSNSKIGYAIMFSTNIKLRNNVSYNNIDQGIMLNYANDSIIDGNAVEKSPKCVYLYNANNNQFTNNHFEGCEMGIHFSGAAEGNVIRENAFVNNQTQIKYVGTRFMDWADGGKGNYWSDNSAFDLDGDGIADTAYKPNNITDQILWRAPSARLLMNSPAVSIVKWAQKEFPAIMPGGMTDSRPLMVMPEPPALLILREIKARERKTV